MAFSKVTLNGDTLMDVTQKTVTAATMLSGTTALKNDGTDVTGNIPSKSSSDLTVSGATVTAPAGFYSVAASKSVTSGSATTPATTITANPTVSVVVNSGKNLFDMDCLLEADGWVEENGDYYGQIRRVLEEYPVGTGVPIYGGLKENTQYTVSLTVRIDSEQGTNNGLTVVAYYSDGTHANVCGALRNQTTWTRISGTTTSGKTVTEICISYSNGGANVWHIKEAQIEEGATLSDYTPYAMQAAVNATVSASQSVTPTVSAGYVSAGTAGTVSVGGSGSETVFLSDLVSGTKSITASGTTDVTNYASASVAAGSATTPATSITANPTVSVTVGPGKNLLPYEIGDYASSASGLTFNILSDGGVHISGTSSAVSGYHCYSNTSSAMNLPAGNYRFLLTGSGTGFDNASIQLYTDTGSGLASRNYGKDFTYTIASSVTADYVRIRCAADTYDCTVYPMVMDSSNTDTTWEAYAIQAKATASVSASQSITPTVSAGYVSTGTAGTVTVSGSNTQQLTVQEGLTITPSTSQQVAVTTGKYTVGDVVVAPIPSNYVIPSGTYTAISNGTYDVSPYAFVSVDVANTLDPSGTNMSVDGTAIVIGEGGGGGGTTPASPKDVNFIDYDGTILYSYTKAEFAQLTALPANPDHSGDDIPLTSQGWNWTLAQINAQLTAQPNDPVTVGQMYVTTDGKTYIEIELHEGRLSPYLGIAVNGTVVVDWGDNTATSTVTGTSLTTQIRTLHEYAAAGRYTISISVSSGSFAFYCTSTYTLLNKNSSTAIQNQVYSNAVQSVRIGNNASINSYAFAYCYSLALITIPSGVTSISDNAFYTCYSLASITIPSGVTSISSCALQNCYSLALITIPSGVTSISSYAFYACYSLALITIPSGVTSIGNSTFYTCYSLASITIPSGVTSISSYAFQNCYSLALITIPSGVTSIDSSALRNCYGLAKLRFLPTTPPTVLNSNTFTNIPTDCVISVPTGKKSDYTGATNYPDSGTYTYIEE